VFLNFLPALPFLTSSAALEASARGTSRAKNCLNLFFVKIVGLLGAACRPLLGRETQVHQLNSSLQRLLTLVAQVRSHLASQFAGEILHTR
jgi:hypothetical protein